MRDTVRFVARACQDETYSTFRYFGGMEQPHERLQQARAAKRFENATDAARAYGWNENTYRSHENGERGLKRDVAARYAKAFGVSTAWLLTGEGPQERKNVARVMGFIGAGAEILPEVEQVPEEGLFEIEVPFPIPEDAVAFEVQGDSMWPRYDPGDVIVCWRFGTRPEEIVGWEAAVRTKDGKRYLKRILEGGRKGLFDLESYNAPPIRGVRLEWVGRVSAVVRAGDWARRDNAGRRKLLRRAVAAE